MQIVLNGEKTVIEGHCNVRQLVEKLGLEAGQVAVEVNREIVSKSRWNEHVLSDGDQVEVVHFVGGGGD